MTTETRLRSYRGHTSEAYGADPSDVDKTYQFRYKVLDLDSLIPSHTDVLAVNPAYPKELQPRIRERAASRMQIDTMAQNLNPKVLLRDTGFLDTGPMIVGDDDVVESGNGRVLALRKAMQDHPEKYRLYRTMLVNQAETYGLKDKDIEGIKHPVLVRERITPVDRVKFAAEANTSNVLAMSPFEQAVQDAGRLPAATIQTIEVGEDESIDQALRRKSNAPIVAKFYDSMPANERASIVDNKGEITASGLNRLKLAIFTKTYSGDAGQRLARTFSESLDPNIKNMESAMFQSLPDMAKAESLIAGGAREKDLSIAPDMAEVIDTYAALKQKGLTVDQYLAQHSMFADKLNPTQQAMLEHLDDQARSPKKIREFIRDVAGQIEAAPAKGQGGMFGETYEITKEKIVNASINKQRRESGKDSITIAAAATSRKGLEESHAGRDEGAQGVPGERKGAGGVQEVPLAPSTSVQVGLGGFGHEQAQVQMFGEVSGKESRKDTLIDVEKEKAKEAAKPLPGQIELPTAKAEPKPEGQARVTFQAGHLDSTIAAAKRHHANHTLYVFGTAMGFRIRTDPPPGTQQYVEIHPDGTTKTVSFDERLKQQEERWKTRTGDEPTKEVPKASPPKPVAQARKPTGTAPIKGELIIAQDARSNQAKAMDAAQQHSIVVPMKSPRTRAWLRNPGSMDVETLDTKHVTIRQLPDHERKDKPMFRINRKSGSAGRGRDLGADIVRDRRGRHLRL